jgi:NADH:ubiquinone oxidoreductase subunit 6 (subunit J)
LIELSVFDLRSAIGSGKSKIENQKPKMADLHTFLFWAVAVATGLSAIAVVVTQNIVRAATWLLFTLGGVSATFFLIGADFVGATQLLVYVGGTLVLVVFGVMLTAQGPFITMKTSAAEWGLAAGVGLIFLGVLVVSLTQPDNWPGKDQTNPRMTNAQTSTSSQQLGLAFFGFREATPDALLTGVRPGSIPMGQKKREKVGYLLPFEIVSVHLLVVLLGAAYLARAKRRRQAVTQ